MPTTRTKRNVMPDGSVQKTTTFFDEIEGKDYPVRNHTSTIRPASIPVDYSNKNSTCKTPGAIYVTKVKEATISEPAKICVEVRLPHKVKLTEAQAIEIESKAHDFFEKLLAKHFK